MQRIRALSDDEVRQPRKVFYLFLESALIQEFDGDMHSPAEWASLAKSVMARMESDIDLQKAIHEAGRLLVTVATNEVNRSLSTDSTDKGAPHQTEAPATGLNAIQ